MDRILIILKKENGPRASSAPALGLNTVIFKHAYWYMQQISGKRLQDHWSSGFLSPPPPVPKIQRMSDDGQMDKDHAYKKACAETYHLPTYHFSGLGNPGQNLCCKIKSDSIF